jgi:hypothetical protein
VEWIQKSKAAPSRKRAQGRPESKFRQRAGLGFLTPIFQRTRLSSEVKMPFARHNELGSVNNVQHGAPREATISDSKQ